MEAKHSFHTMGTMVNLAIDGNENILENAVQKINECEQKWSRFITTSEISKLNQNNGRWHDVSDETIELIKCMREGYRLSDGIFDPTIIGEMLNIGYVTSFPFDSAESVENSYEKGMEKIAIDKNRVYMPLNVGLDPGGIGKGLVADIVADMAIAQGAKSAIIDVGGDVAIRSNSDINFEIPICDESGKVIDLVFLNDCSIATSTTLKRKWLLDSKVVNHIIDPRSSFSAQSDIYRASVISRKCWQGEVFAKTLIILGSEDADLFGERLEIPYSYSTNDEYFVSKYFEDFRVKVNI